MWLLAYGWCAVVYVVACTFTKTTTDAWARICSDAQQMQRWWSRTLYWLTVLVGLVFCGLVWPILLPFKIWLELSPGPRKALRVPLPVTPPDTQAGLGGFGAGPQVGQITCAYPTNACRACAYPYPTAGALAGVCTACGMNHCAHCPAMILVTAAYWAKCDTCTQRACPNCTGKPCALAAAAITHYVLPGSTPLCTIPCTHSPDCTLTATVYKNALARQGWHRVLCPAGHWGDLGPDSALLPPEHRKG